MSGRMSSRFIYVKMQMANPARMDRWEEVGLLIDTESRLSVMPRPILEELRIQFTGRRRFRVLGGERETGGVVLKYRGHIAAAPVIVGEDNDTPILGLRALEALDYEVDHITGELRPTEMLL
ncbi:MAG: hypothetical protein HW388_682 [Dehalococcoidia bacterium]|nr:hypothetical protein [Dehalococcoidia bacterium]